MKTQKTVLYCVKCNKYQYLGELLWFDLSNNRTSEDSMLAWLRKEHSVHETVCNKCTKKDLDSGT